MGDKYTPEDVIKLVHEELDAGRKVKAKTILALTTNLGIKRRREVVEGHADLLPEHIVNTDLDNLNKPGCSIGAAALIISAFLLSRLF